MILLTEVSWIVVGWTVEIELREIGHECVNWSLVNAPSAGNRVQVIEFLEYQRTGLMNGADDRSTLAGEIL